MAVALMTKGQCQPLSERDQVDCLIGHALALAMDPCEEFAADAADLARFADYDRRALGEARIAMLLSSVHHLRVYLTRAERLLAEALEVAAARHPLEVAAS